jgi:uncharacterized protein YecE (DUF72 family)
MSRNVRIGCQSWGYEDWVTKPGGDTVFYPHGTRPAEMLELYSRVFDTIEVDATAYGPPTASTIESWYAKAPPGFSFSLKVPRRITHDHILEPSVYGEMEEFLERVAGLREKLGAILIQFPAVFESSKENAKKLRAFLSRLPEEFKFAVEFRSPGWFVDWTYEELASRSIALALVEGKWVDREVMFASMNALTAKLAYVRFMGVRDLEIFDRIQRPQDPVIEFWAEKLDGLEAEDVFIYVDNYFEGFAPETANKLKHLMELVPVDPNVLEEQPSLF